MPISEWINAWLSIVSTWVINVFWKIISIVFIIWWCLLFLHLCKDFIKWFTKAFNNEDNLKQHEINDIEKRMKFNEEIIKNEKDEIWKWEQPKKLKWSWKVREESYNNSPAVLVSKK